MITILIFLMGMWLGLGIKLILAKGFIILSRYNYKLFIENMKFRKILKNNGITNCL